MASWRYLAVNPITGAMIHPELPFRRDTLRYDLSAAGSLSGTISPVDSSLLDSAGRPLIGPWSTAIFAEKDGEIRWGGLINRGAFDGPTWGIEAIGYSGYAAGIPYLGATYSKIQIDPTLVVLNIWGYIQASVSNIGLTVIRPTNCPVRVGTAAVKASGTTEAQEAQPYLLTWWEAKDLGSEVETLSKETPFDYTERHYWKPDGTIGHELVIGYPRIGRKRTDLAFIQGDNVAKVVVVEYDGTEFSNHVVVLGKGEGNKTLRGESVVDDGRLRRPFIYADKSAGTVTRCRTLASQQRLARDLDPRIASIEVIDHENAKLGSFAVGDDILVDAQTAWLGRVQTWHRITSYTITAEDRAVLTLAPSDTFTYGATA